MQKLNQRINVGPCHVNYICLEWSQKKYLFAPLTLLIFNFVPFQTTLKILNVNEANNNEIAMNVRFRREVTGLHNEYYSTINNVFFYNGNPVKNGSFKNINNNSSKSFLTSSLSSSSLTLYKDFIPTKTIQMKQKVKKIDSNETNFYALFENGELFVADKEMRMVDKDVKDVVGSATFWWSLKSNNNTQNKPIIGKGYEQNNWFGYGSNNNNQLGERKYLDGQIYKQIKVGTKHSILLRYGTNGDIVIECLGNPEYSCMAQVDDWKGYSVPAIKVVTNKFKKISIGTKHSLIVLSDGVVGFGNNEYGQIEPWNDGHGKNDAPVLARWVISGIVSIFDEHTDNYKLIDCIAIHNMTVLLLQHKRNHYI